LLFIFITHLYIITRNIALTLLMYSMSFTNNDEEVFGTLAMKDLGVNAMVLNVDDDHVVPSHTVAQAFKVPNHKKRNEPIWEGMMLLHMCVWIMRGAGCIHIHGNNKDNETKETKRCKQQETKSAPSISVTSSALDLRTAARPKNKFRSKVLAYTPYRTKI
jgi:hypothetical protein